MTNHLLIGEAPHIVDLLSATTGTACSDEDRVRGTILGLAVGNLLGLPVEGWSAARIDASHSRGVTEINPLERSRPMDDDLAQAVDLAESLLAGGDFVTDFSGRLVRWRRENGRGIGFTTSAVIDLLEEGHPPPEAARIIYENRDRIAPNGGVMRCAPVALARHADPERLVSDSAATCAVTHYAPSCQWSCIIINAAILCYLRPSTLQLKTGQAARSRRPPAEVGEWATRLGTILAPLDQGHIGHTLLCMQAAFGH